jgi:hypothetical protein
MLTNALRRWTKRINAKTTNRRARLSARRPLLLEQLEDRVVPAVIFNSPFGGDSIFWFPGNGAGMPAYQPVDSPLSSNPTALNSPNVYLIFSGQSWTNATAQRFANDVDKIINHSAYLSRLSDYGSNGQALFNAANNWTIDNSAAPASDPTAGTNEIDKIVPTTSWVKPSQAATSGAFFWPGAVTAPIYVVVFDTDGTTGNGVDAYVPQGTQDPPLAMNHIWIANSGNDENWFTTSFSHELVERMSDGGGGIKMNARVSLTSEWQNAQIVDNEPDAGGYDARLQGTVLVEAYWSISADGFIVPDTTSGPTVYVNPVWNGVNTSSPSFTGKFDLLIQKHTAADNTPGSITINDPYSDPAAVTVDGTPFTFRNKGKVRNITVFDYSGSTVTVLGNLGRVSIWSVNGGTNVTVGNGNVGDVAAEVDVLPVDGTVTLNLTVDDHLDATGPSAALQQSSSSDAVGIGYDALTGLAPGHIVYDGTSVFATVKMQGGSLVVNTTGSRETVFGMTAAELDLNGTGGFVKVDGADDAVVNVGNTFSPNQNLQNIGGPVYVDSTGGTVNLHVNDANDNAARSATLDQAQFFGVSFMNLSGLASNGWIGYEPSSVLATIGLGGATTLTVNWTGVAVTTIDPTPGASVNLRANRGVVYVRGSGGSVTVGENGTLGGILMPVHVYPDSGPISLTVDDSMDGTSPTATLGDLTSGNPPDLNVQELDIDSSDPNLSPVVITYAAASLAANVKTTIALGSGTLTTTDTAKQSTAINLTGANANILGTRGYVAVHATGGGTVLVGEGSEQAIRGEVDVDSADNSAKLIVDDANDTSAHPSAYLGTTFISAGWAQLSGLSQGFIKYEGDQVTPTIDLGANTTLRVLALDTGTLPTIVSTNGPGDTLNVQGTWGDLTIQSGTTSTDTVTVGDLLQSLDYIGGAVSVTGNGQATLRIEDAKGTGGFVLPPGASNPVTTLFYNLDGQQVTRVASIRYSLSSGGIASAMNNLPIAYSGLRSLELDGSNLGAGYTISGPAAPTTVIGGSGGNTFNVQSTAAGTTTRLISATGLPDGLVSLWRGDGNANDILGTNNGTLQTGVTFAPGMTSATGDQAFSFNGSNALVDVGHDPSLNISGSLTVSAWVNVQSLIHAEYLFADFDSTGKLSQGSLGILATGEFFWFQGNQGVSNGWVEPFGATRVNLNQWYHVAVVRDDNAKTITLYVNGVQDGSVSYAGIPVLPLQGDKLLGGSGPGFARDSFSGLLDDVGLFNRALSAAEIQSIYNSRGSSPSNTFNIGSTMNTLDSIQGALSIYGQGAGTTLNINDSATTASQTYEVYATSIHRRYYTLPQPDDISPISYYNVRNLNLNLGSARTGFNFGNVEMIAEVYSTPAGTITTINGGSGIGLTGINLFTIAPFDSGPGIPQDNRGILGDVHVHGGGSPYDTATYYDYLDPVGQQTYTLSGTATGGQIVDSGSATVTYDSNVFFSGLFTGWHGNNTVNILSTAVHTQIQASTGDHVIAGMPVVSGGRTLASINGFLGVQSTDGNPNVVPAGVVLDDSGDMTAHRSVAINGGAVYPGPDVVGLAQAAISWRGLAPTTPVTILGGSGGNTFMVNALPTNPLTLDGGAGTHNKLDYSGYTGTVKAILPLGYATGFASVSRIQDVTGSNGNNLIVGSSSPGVLTGGTGRNIIIAHTGADTITGGGGVNMENILIGGYTTYDSNRTALDAIFNEWTSSDSLTTRMNDLSGKRLSGLDLNGSNTLNPFATTNPPQTVFSNGAADQLFDGAGMSWFFFRPPNDKINNGGPLRVSGDLVVVIH